MPKTTMGTPSFVRKAEAEEQADERCMTALEFLIRMKMRQKGITNEQMSTLFGKTCEASFTRRLNNPARFSYAEMLKIFRVLEFDDHDILSVCREVTNA